MTRIDKLLFLAAISSFGLFDAVTTVVAADYLGSYAYESSMVLRSVEASNGAVVLLLVKLWCVLVALLVALYVAEHSRHGYTAKCCMIGTTIAGLYAGLSNLNIIFAGSSFQVLGFDTQVISIILLLGFGCIGAMMDAVDHAMQPAKRTMVG